jgi:hypothetical protein
VLVLVVLVGLVVLVVPVPAAAVRRLGWRFLEYMHLSVLQLAGNSIVSFGFTRDVEVARGYDGGVQR